MKNKKIVIAGGTGFIGQAMAEYFGNDNTVIILTRGKSRTEGRIRYIHWNARTIGTWGTELEHSDLLINLAGKSVNCRYNARNKQEIFDSRVSSTKVLGAVVQQLAHPPALWINAASATIYRHAEDRPMDELTGEMHNDFSVQVCQLWEKTFNDIPLMHTRKVILRMAIALGWQGGVMMPYLNLLKFGLGGHQGKGTQRYSWIHITDVCRMTDWLYEQPRIEGTFNCCAPHPVTNTHFMRLLRRTAGHYFGLPAPALLLAMGARLIGSETELLLKSRWVLPTRIQQAGFTFQFPELYPAFQDILAHLPRRRYHLF